MKSDHIAKKFNIVLIQMLETLTPLLFVSSRNVIREQI